MRRAARAAGLGALGLGGAVGAAAAAGCAISPGFRRSVRFYSKVTPFVAEHYAIKARAQYYDRCSEQELDARLSAFHKRTAARCVEVILDLGGIYVKIGQFASTMGAGVLEDAYIEALRPLQDGVPPRPLSEVAAIIERSTGLTMQALFEHFEPTPVGAASIAQAHIATLMGGQRCIVKVQYPEVAQLYEADFDNLETVVEWMMPENAALIRGLRKRHVDELDFRTEAAHLREVSANMRAHGLEPQLVRVPRVLDAERLCTQHVLCMELFEGVSLAASVKAEQEALATALGMENAEEMRLALMRRVRAHFEHGGDGSGSDKGSDGGSGGGGDGGSAQLLLQAGLAAAPLLRAYVSARRRVHIVMAVAWNCGAQVVRLLSLGHLAPAFRVVPQAASAVDLGRVLKTLVHVHGIQMLLDGVYNCDPHPGNVIVLPDGRVGLIDFGMVGRLEPEQRLNVARTVLALHEGDVEAVAQIYRENGYRAGWHSGEAHGSAAIHRFASFHLDRINLSDVAVNADRAPSGQMPVMKLLRSTIELRVPDWVEQARRLGGLLIGVGSQTARPISLAAEWAPIARQLLAEQLETSDRTV